MKTEPRPADQYKSAAMVVRLQPGVRQQISRLACKQGMSLSRFMRAKISEIVENETAVKP